MSKYAFLASCILCLLACTGLIAQTSNATLGGTVGDSSGALIPGVSVTATNAGTGIVTTVLSNESGAYHFASLQPGSYRVSAELPGFQTQTYNNVALGLSQQVRLNITLSVSTVAQSVEVTVAADTLIATSSSSVGNVLPEYKVRDLPLGSRNVLDLVGTTAGTGPTGDAVERLLRRRPGQRGCVSARRFYRFRRPLQSGHFCGDLYESRIWLKKSRSSTATVDAEASRGSGQVSDGHPLRNQSVPRKSCSWNNRNSALDAANWFNNFNSTEATGTIATSSAAVSAARSSRTRRFSSSWWKNSAIVTKETRCGPGPDAAGASGSFPLFSGSQQRKRNGDEPDREF